MDCSRPIWHLCKKESESSSIISSVSFSIINSLLSLFKCISWLSPSSFVDMNFTFITLIFYLSDVLKLSIMSVKYCLISSRYRLIRFYHLHFCIQCLYSILEGPCNPFWFVAFGYVCFCLFPFCPFKFIHRCILFRSWGIYRFHRSWGRNRCVRFLCRFFRPWCSW